MNQDRRLIEDFIPIREISAQSAREKSIRKGHISTLHLWWARRPLVAARAAVYASLVAAPESEQKRTDLTNFMIDLCKWEAGEPTIEKAQQHILEAQKKRLGLPEEIPLEDVPPPKVLDMFAGGGAIPLEALRLGCETHAIDLNPVAHIIELCTLVYPQKYGKKLADEVEKWGNWVIENVREEIGDLYPGIEELGVRNSELGEHQELGVRNSELGENLENAELQRIGGLAEGDRIGGESLSNNLEVSSRGEVCTDISNPESGNVSSSQYSGGMGARLNEGVHLPPENIEGFSDGTGDSFDSSSTAAIQDKFGKSQINSARNRSHWQNVKQTHHQSGEKNLATDGEQLSLFTSLSPQLPTPNSQLLTPVAYLWTRTVKCPNPGCGADVPLVRQTWLCKKSKKYVALKVTPNYETKKVEFEVVESTTEKSLGFNPAAGSSRGNSVCRHCGTTVDVKYVKQEGNANRINQQLMAIVCTTPGEQGKTYLSGTDYQKYVPDEIELNNRLEKLCVETGLTTPDEPLPNYGVLGFRVQPYGLLKWSDLFTPRQLLSLMTFVKWVRLAHEEMLQQGYEEDFGKAIATYLGILCDKLAMFNCSLTRWFNHREGICPVFSNQALPMVWDFIEGNPLCSGSGSWESAQLYIKEVICTESYTTHTLNLQRTSAMAMPITSESLDAVITDPPYFDSVPYADLSDFFYVWLKRSIGYLYSEHFSGKLTPKKKEAIMEPSRHGGDKKKASQAYQDMMYQAFLEANRVLKSDGIMAVVYAHKTTAGWSTLIDSLRRAGFTITEAWPLDTESVGRLRAIDSAALTSSIFLITRKRGTPKPPLTPNSQIPIPNNPSPTPNSQFLTPTIGDYAIDVQPQLQEIIKDRVQTLMSEGVSGADLVIACIGAGLRAYTQYDSVELPNGDELDANNFLDEVQKEVLETILSDVLLCDKRGVSVVDKPTQYYILGRYEYREAIVEFDEANTLARGVGVELDGAGGLTDGKLALVKKTKNEIQLRDYSERGENEELGIRSSELRERKKFNTPTTKNQNPTLIDILHRLLWLLEHKPQDVGSFLNLAAPDSSQLRLVAQALAGRALTPDSNHHQEEVISQRTQEQQAIDTLLASWKRVIEENLFTSKKV